MISYRTDPMGMLTKPLHDLLRFDDVDKQTQFSTLVYETIEDVAYAGRQAVHKMDDILKVKLETPGIGRFVETALVQRYGDSGSVLTEMLDEIDQRRDTALMAAMGVFGTFYQQRSVDVLHQQYNTHFPTCDIVPVHFVSSFETHSPDAIFEKDWHYSMHPYNSFFEKVIGGVGAVCNYVYNNIVDTVAGFFGMFKWSSPCTSHVVSD
jgi:hypothetical protein